MKNVICIILCTITALLINVQVIHAAFPVHAASGHRVLVKTEKRSFEEFINAVVEKYHQPVPPVDDETDEGGKILNLFAFGLGMTGLIGLITAFLAPTFALELGGIAIGAAIAAIIIGNKGMDRSPLRGLGIAGFVLGIIDLTALVIALIALLIATLFFLSLL